MKTLVIIYLFFGFVIGQSFQALPNNVFRISIDQTSSKSRWDRGKHKFSLDGIGKMYFDPFTHNDSVRFSSNFDLYHTGSFYMSDVVTGGDTLKPASTVEDWMEQFNADYNFNLPVLGPQNIDTNIFMFPDGYFFEEKTKEILSQTLRIDYGFSNDVTLSISIPFLELFSIKQSISDVTVSNIQGAQALVDYHQNAKAVFKDFFDSVAYDDLPGDSLENILDYIYGLYYRNNGMYSLNWILHAQDDPINNLLVDNRFIPDEMRDDNFIHIDSLVKFYYPTYSAGKGIGDIDIGAHILLKGDPAWSSDRSTEAIYGQIFVSVPFGKTLSDFKASFIDEDKDTTSQLDEVVLGKGTYRWKLGLQGIHLLKGENVGRVYYQGQIQFSLVTTLNTPVRLFSGGHTHADSIIQNVGNTYKYDLGNGLFIRAGGEYEVFKNRLKFLGELSSAYKGMDNYLSQSPRWDNWMEERMGTKSYLDFKFELWFINSISSNRIGPFAFDTYVGYKETLIANNTYGGKQFYIGFSTFYQGW